MSIFRALDAAASGLVAQQRAMDVIANDIANAHTPGYARRRALLAPRGDERIGGVVLGRGVHVAAVRRIVDPMLERMLAGAQSQTQFWKAQAGELRNLAPVFGELGRTKLAGALDRFLSAWQGLAARPADATRKALVREAAQGLADTIRQTRARLVQAADALGQRIADGVGRVNAILDELAGVRVQIARLERAPSMPAGNLRDRQAALLNELASWIPFQQVQGGGEPMLATPGGGLLLAGAKARHLAVRHKADGTLQLVWADTGAPTRGLDGGGRIGGWLQLRDQRLAGYRKDLDAWAADLAFRVNALHGSYAQASWSGAPSNPALPLSDPAQPNALAARVTSGAFTVHLYDASGAPVQPGGYTITITQGVTTMNDVAAQLSALPGVTAQVDAAGRLSVQVQGGGTLAFGRDTSGFLAAWGVGGVFQGHDAATIRLAPAVAASADAIAPGYADPATSAIAPGDGAAAQAVFGLASSDLPARLDGWIAGFGADAQNAQGRARAADAAEQALARRREQVSGVNTDEEMIAMLRAQRAFEAAAKAIAASNRMLDALMGMVR